MGAPPPGNDPAEAPPASTSSPPPSAPEGFVPVKVGDVLAGKYQVGAILGYGGVGVVVSATHLMLQQKVAIKVLFTNAAPDMIARFQREGQAAVRLKGDHVARVLDMGQLPSGAPFMVMEYLEGRDLSGELEQRGRLPIEDAVAYVLHACEAMAEAHAAGIIHRDLKPANLFLARSPDGSARVKVVDFGISGDLGAPAQNNHRLTRTTSVFGSPLYMPPEQMRSTRMTDERSDIWSLGVILYELITGRTPFEAELYPDLVLKVATEAPQPPSAFRREVPPQLEAVILRCLEKPPPRRFPDVGQLAAALAPFAPPSARVNLERIARFFEHSAARLTPPPGSARADAVMARTGAAAPRKPIGLIAAVVVAGALVLAGVAVLIAVWLGRADPAPIEPATEPPAPAMGEPVAPAPPEGPPAGDVRVTPSGTGAASAGAVEAPATAAPRPTAAQTARPGAGGTAKPRETSGSRSGDPLAPPPQPTPAPVPAEDPLKKLQPK